MTKKFSFRRVTLAVLATLLAVCAAFTLLSVKGKTAFAADFSYKEGRDGYSYNADSSLTVKFTVTDGGQEIGGAFNTWIVYLIHENTGITYNPTTHKYTDNSDRGSNVAAYYFPVDSTGQTGAGSHTVTVASDAIAYRGSPSSATNYGTNTGKTFAEVFETENWIVGVGPMFDAWWGSGVAAPIDYYVGRAADVLASTVTFRNYDESVISSSSLSMSADITIPAYTALDANAYEFLGWYCDTTDKIYSAAQIADLKVSDVVDSTRSVNFYAAYNQKFSKYIEFTTYAIDGDNNQIDAKIVDTTDNVADTITVVYDITHNDGVNEILLIPEYDREVFSIASVESVSVKNNTVLGVAEIGTDGRYAIELGSTTLYTELDASFITITFAINGEKVVAEETDYTFGLKLYSRTKNDSSKAIYKDDGGNIYDMGIVVKTKTLALSAIKDSTIRSRSHTFTYSKQAVTAACVDNYTYYEYNNSALTVYFDYDGDATEFTYVWYESNGTTVRSTAPQEVGIYYVDITAPTTVLYKSTTTRVKVSIVRREIKVYINNQSSVYLDNIVTTLTSTTEGTILEGDDLDIQISTTATSTSDVGTYPISGSYDTSFENHYDVTFYNGTYEITARAITITAIDQSATYNGDEPEVVPSAYTVTRIVDNETVEEDLPAGATVVLTKAAGVNVGTYDIVPSSAYFVDNANYAVTYENGTFTIESVTTGEVAVIKNFFKGINGNPYETTYNGLYQKLVVTTTETPAWVINHIVDSNGYYKRDAGAYNGITVTLSFNAQDAANYTNGEQSIVFTVDAVINKAAITVSADAKTANYGDAAKDLTSTITSGTLYGKAADNDYYNASALSEDTLNVTLTTETIINNSTPVGIYDIVIGATNANYNITLVDNTYTIVKATVSDTDDDGEPDDATDDNDDYSGVKISLSATDVYYNRDLIFTYKVKVGTQVLAANAYTVKFYSDSACTNEVEPEDAGLYYIKVSVPGTDNYDGASKVRSFKINKIQLAAPNVSYNGATVTLSTVITDDGGKTLKEGTTVSYVINSVDCTSNRSYTATSTGAFAYVIDSNNSNYIAYEGTTKICYSIAFAEGSHAYNPVVLEVPATLYCFNTSSVILPAALNLDGYNFVSWDGNNAESAYAPSANVTLDAIWSAIEYTVSFKYTESGEIAYSNTFYYGQAVTYPTATVVPVKYSDNAGIYYSFADKWTKDATEYAFTTEEGIATVTGVNVYGDMVFVAVFDKNFNTFTITYYRSQKEATTGYVQFGETQVLYYGEVITYLSYTSNYQWFKTDFWYLDAARTQSVPVTMPNANIEVYGSYKFDIGAGDVNADGKVNADDITLYRQWIVGGYEMTVVENGDEWDTALSYNANANTRYFFKRVADINADSSKDIRDVSITRMSIVDGYNWDILTGENVSGAEIVRTYQSITVNEIASRLNSGKRVILGDNIEDVNGVIEVNFSGNVYIDLNGKTLTVYSFAVNTDKKDATIIVKNGTIVTVDGIVITAPNGNVILTDVTGYDENGEVNLQAASNSLHLNGEVKFYDYDDAENVEENATVAAVKVEQGTHVVIEKAATVVVEKFVVTENFVADVTKAISLQNNTVNTVTIEGQNTYAAASIGDVKYEKFVDAVNAVNASANGGTITLLDDIDFSTEIYAGYKWVGSNYNPLTITNSNVTIDLNGHSIYNMGNTAICAGNILAADGSIENFTIKNGTLLAGKTNNVTNSYVLGIAGVNGALVKDVTTLGGINVYTASQNVVIDGCNVQGAKYYSVCSQCGSSVIIRNSNVTKNTDSSVATKAMFWIDKAGHDSDLATSTNPNGDYVASSITIESGNYTVDFENGGEFYLTSGLKPVVVGGTFNFDPSAYIVEGGVVCEIGSDWKAAADLVKAVELVNASENGGTIKLVADIDFSTEIYAGYKWAGSTYNPLTITKDNVTIDLNGHTISNMGNTALVAGNILAKNGGIENFTIKNGTLLAGKTNNVTNSYVLGIAGVNGALVKDVTTLGGINVYTASQNVVIDGCNVQGAKYYSVCSQCGSSVIIRNSNVTKNTDSSVATKAMFWIDKAGHDSDLATSTNPNGDYVASSITIESGNYTVDFENGGIFYLTSGLAPVVEGGTFNFDINA